jgi:hypothetical protein
MTFTMALFALAVLMCMAGAKAGNRASWPLLGYAAICIGLRLGEAPFNLAVAFTVDVFAMLGIVAVWIWNLKHHLPVAKWRDVFVIALFAPIWVFYLWQPSWWCPAIETLVAAQLGAMFPWKRAFERVAAFLNVTRDDPPLMMARA